MITILLWKIYFSAEFVIDSKTYAIDKRVLAGDHKGGRNVAILQLSQRYDIKLKPICLPEDLGELSAGDQVE